MKLETIADAYPLSPMQQGMLFHHLSARQPGVDIQQILGTLREAIDTAAFERAWQHAVERHTILRTGFRWVDGNGPQQVVHGKVLLHFENKDWRGLAQHDQKDRFEACLQAERAGCFDLNVPPLMRLVLCRTGEAEFRLIWTFHHVLLDGRAIAVLLNEVFAIYEALASSGDLELPPPCPYRDYITWLQKQDLSQAEQFWRENLKGFTSATPLVVGKNGGEPFHAFVAADVSRRTTPQGKLAPTNVGGYEGVCGEQQIGLSEAVTAALKTIARENKLTLNTILQGAWALLLSRYSGEEDVVFGAIRACRHSTVEGAESIIGLFINNVPLRIKAPADSWLLPWLAGLREAWLALRDYEHTPLIKIRAWSDVPPGAQTGLFETIFNFQDPSWDAALLAQGGKWATREFGIRSQSNYPLAVDAYGSVPTPLPSRSGRDGSAVVIKMLYHRNRFEDETITRMLGHLKTLLEGMAEDPVRQLWQLPLLTEAERHQSLIEWNETAAEFPQNRCVHKLFEEQARRTPDALAVADGKGRRSYHELDEQANRLAQELRSRGVGPEVRVGVCLERSVEMVAAWLAVLKAGGAYVPLDPSYPPERLAFMLADAQAPILLTQSSLRERFNSGTLNLEILSVDTLSGVRSAECGMRNEGGALSTPHSALRTPHSCDLAYVIYTSGSTGRPKGVEIQHDSLANLAAWHQRVYQVTPADRATQVASPAFDAAVWEIWPYLTCGASVHIPDEDTRLSPRRLLDWLAASGITLSFIPTPLAEALFDDTWPENIRLRALLTGGDKLHRPPGENIPCPLFNHYGPTENTVVTTCIGVPPNAKHNNAPPIGRPISNTQVYILDRHLHPVPVGVPGELHIGGVGLSRGYLNRPELTAEKFIPNPFSSDPTSRLYKTGDLARYLPDGNIEFLGRGDQQVKVRGHRIELGEIESVLSGHELVSEVAVAAFEDRSGENRLVGYVVLKNRRNDATATETREVPPGGRARGIPPLSFGLSRTAGRAPAESAGMRRTLPPGGTSRHTDAQDEPTAQQDLSPVAELQRFLRQKLPDYMTPSAFVFLPALPLTPNGKVDRKALPAPDLNAESERVFAPARTPTEQTLSAIWSEVLGLPRVGIHDDFFELGGHSLLAAQVMSRVGRACQVDMPISELFEAPTIAELAGSVEEGRGSRVEGPQRSLFRSSLAPRPSPLDTSPLSFAQERLWFLEQMEPGQAFNNIPLAIRLEGRLDIAALRRAFDDIVSRHAPLRTAFTTTNGQAVAVTAPAQPIPLPIVDLTRLPQAQREREAERLSQEEARQPFDLTQSPLLRLKLARLADNEHLLLLTTHHIACDGWSLGVFYRELAALYEAHSTGRQSPMPELPIDYADFADWQRHWLQGQVLDDQLAYWKQQLSGAQTTLDLPTDRPRPPLQTYHGDIQHFALPSHLATALNALARREDATLFMVLLAAFQTLLHRYTGQQDILVGSSSAGRSRVETEGLIGLFLNTLVLRGDLSDDPPFRKLVSQVRQVALDAYAHQDLPFEKLVEALPLPRDLSRSPLFQAMFILQNEPLRPLELARLKLTPMPAHSGTAKFDLTLSLEEMDDGLAGYIEFNSDLFDEETIVRMLRHYQTLLEAVVADADQRLSAMPLLTEHERKQVLLDWNDTRTHFDEDSCVHQLFERQVARNPDAIAAVFEDEHLTYRELNESANDVARELQVLGAGPDVRVGICVERSLEMMIGLFGILKSGGCYVPLDPKYPKERLAFMLEDAQVPVLLTQQKLQSQFKFELPNLKLVSLEAPRFQCGMRSAECRVSPHADFTPHSALPTPHPKNLAYVIYTSGSTGKPKGVTVTHRNVANFFAGMDELLGTKPGVWLAVTSISFDISVLELFWTLARGYKVAIQPDASASGETPGAAISQQIVRHGVTHLQCTPSFANALILAPESLQALGRLKKLLLGGEALPVSLAQQLSAMVPGGLLNMYGPTETTVWSATHRVGQVTHSVPIGRPIANTQIYILDRQLQPIPAGVPGEIFIGGEGVARGYLNRPELTAQKFIPNPVKLDLESRRQAPSPTRLYRTGDLGRWRRDGAIEFLGRLDQQVKIRGHRIELGEIEAVLGRHPAVREVAVVAREDQPGDQRLIAYFIAASGARPKAGELRQFAQEKLPEAMVPAACVFLDEMPRTPNGKIDRKALPAPRGDRPELETSFVAPRTQMERTIARIWQELLGVEKVGLHDNFFDLGGHSLLVVRAQSQLQQALGVVLPVVKLFQYPTISALAGFLSEREPASAVRIGNRGRRKQAAYAQRAGHQEEVIA